MLEMEIKAALAYAQSLGADYADIRVKENTTERIETENGQVQNLSRNRSRGAGIRVYVNGAMGFAAASDLDNLQAIAQQAFDTAKASGTLLREKVVLAPKESQQAEYQTPIKIDPFSVPLEEKLAVLSACSAAMAKIEGVSQYDARMAFRRDEVIFADTDGSYITQVFYQSGGHISAKATTETDTQKRSYGNILCAGYEAVQDLQLPEHAEALAAECVALSQAPDCPSGLYDLVIMPTQLFLQIHESVGHPTELDRVLGSEAAFAGASFLSPTDIDSGLRYGSEHVTLVADAVGVLGEKDAQGLGIFAFDDEGVPAQCVTLVDKGIFKAFQTSRDNALVIGQTSSGAGISDGWQNLPIVRMTNISLQPGDFKLDELISGVADGFLLEENKSWSIDDKRINFQFACEIAREIKDGRLTGRIFKNPIYWGKTTEFWGSCDGVCDLSHRYMVGVPNCGKGQPMQVMRVGHASQPARFRKVRLGVDNG